METILLSVIKMETNTRGQSLNVFLSQILTSIQQRELGNEQSSQDMCILHSRALEKKRNS